MRWYFLSPLILQKLIWVPTRGVLYFFGKMEVHGVEHLNKVGSNAIFACNHTSELDPILLPAAIPFWSHFSPIFYTSRGRKFYVNSGWRQHFYGGILFKMWGAFPIFSGLRDYEKSLCHHLEIIEDGGSICMYPEGRITPDGTIQPAKGGVAYLAYATRTPIIPVRLEGAWHVGMRDFFMRRATLRVIFGEAIYPRVAEHDSLSIEKCKIFANEVMEEIKKLKKPGAGDKGPDHSHDHKC